MKKIFDKGFGMKVLNGVAIGSVVVLIPGALLNEIFKALLPIFPQGQFVLTATSFGMILMGVVIGVAVSMMFKFTPIQTASVGMATAFASGGWKLAEDGTFMLKGSGDIINMALTATFAVILILAVADKFKAYAMLLTPTLVLIVAGGLGMITLPYVQMITGAMAHLISNLLQLQPLLMSILVSMIFAMMIVSPLSTVGIALAVNLSGVGSAAANVGICAAAFGLAITGWKSNELGTKIALMLGSPKMAMPNVMKKPKIMIPVLCNAALSAIVIVLLNQQGTPMSAGFGISGLIGPINAINLAGGWTLGNIINAVLAFMVMPIGLAIVFRKVFTEVKPIVAVDDYHIEVQ
ncbi:PTS sugar transporter subunit IIC [Erysipelothrix rhusiopathiae]|nr:PTS sugar transporter subunit IIC [Erysipelothrix rhusiopathiae]MDE9421423.1 PTS sugar transporter subunit IIC [Erysipelothrix rhusiopathiae]